jgi:hypothetical protein
MKIVKTASGKKTVKISKKEWKEIGNKAGWIKEAQEGNQLQPLDGVQKAVLDETTTQLLCSVKGCGKRVKEDGSEKVCPECRNKK